MQWWAELWGRQQIKGRGLWVWEGGEARIPRWASLRKSWGGDRFSSVQSLSCVRLFVTPWTAAHQASLSITNSQSLPKLMSIESVMPSNRLIFPPVAPFSSRLQSFPASGAFPRSRFFAWEVSLQVDTWAKCGPCRPDKAAKQIRQHSWCEQGKLGSQCPGTESAEGRGKDENRRKREVKPQRAEQITTATYNSWSSFLCYWAGAEK